MKKAPDARGQPQRLHEEDLRLGHGEVYLPAGLSRKWPNAGKEWGWHWVFPSDRLSVDPRSGKVRRRHMSEPGMGVISPADG